MRFHGCSFSDISRRLILRASFAFHCPSPTPPWPCSEEALLYMSNSGLPTIVSPPDDLVVRKLCCTGLTRGCSSSHSFVLCTVISCGFLQWPLMRGRGLYLTRGSHGYWKRTYNCHFPSTCQISIDILNINLCHHKLNQFKLSWSHLMG